MPKSLVLKVISEELDYNNIPRKPENEIVKGYCFKNQAEINEGILRLHALHCTAIDNVCKEEKCPLYEEQNFQEWPKQDLQGILFRFSNSAF